MVPVPFSGTLNQNWTNMVHCQLPPNVFFYLSVIRYGAFHQSSFFLRSVGSIGDFFFTLFHTPQRQGWQMRIMCNIARRIGYTWLIKSTAHRAERCDRNDNHTSVWLENSQNHCLPWGTAPRLLLAGCKNFVHFQITHPDAAGSLFTAGAVLIKEAFESPCLLVIITLIKDFWYNTCIQRNRKWGVETNKISPLSTLWCTN